MRAEARSLYRAKKWEAVLAVSARLKDVDPRADDLDDLAGSARAALEATERGHTLATWYQQALQHIDTDAWRQALDALARIQAVDEGYRDTTELTARARRELARSDLLARLAADVRGLMARREVVRLSKPAQLPTLARTITVPEGGNAVAFSPDGRLLAIGCDSDTAHLIEIATGTELFTTRHQGTLQAVNAVAFSPDGRRFATAGGGTARVWDVRTGDQLLKILHWDLKITSGASVEDLAFSPDGRIATVGSDNTARIWDARSGNQQLKIGRSRFIATSWLHGVAFSPDGHRLATASDDNTARIWDAGSGAELVKITHPGEVRAVAFSPDGRRLATASRGTARIWDAGDGAELVKITHSGIVNAVALAPDGRRLATASGKTARIWDAESGAEVAKITHSGTVNAVAFSPDGRLVATASSDKTCQLWQLLEDVND